MVLDADGGVGIAGCSGGLEFPHLYAEWRDRYLVLQREGVERVGDTGPLGERDEAGVGVEFPGEPHRTAGEVVLRRPGVHGFAEVQREHLDPQIVDLVRLDAGSEPVFAV